MFITVVLSVLLTLGPDAPQCRGVEAQLLTATKRIEQGGLDEAKLILLQIRQSHPGCHKVFLGLGRIAAAQRNPAAAEEFFTQYKNSAPSDPEGYYHLGELFLSLSKGRIKDEYFHQADLMSELAVRFGPHHPQALLLRANILLAQGQTSETRMLVEKACTLAPENVNGRFLLGMVLYKQKRYSEAKAQFEKVIGINPLNAWAYDYLALNLERLGDSQNAGLTFQKGLEINQGEFFDNSLQYNYGSFLLRQNELSKAKLHLDRAVDFVPDKRAAYYERARLNLRLRNYQEAREDLNNALRFQSPAGGSVEDRQIYYLLSRVYSELGEVDLAKKYAGLTREAPANSESSAPEGNTPPKHE